MAWISTNELVQAQIDSFKHYADTSFHTAIEALNQISGAYSDSPQAAGYGTGSLTTGNVAGIPDYVKPEPAPEAVETPFNIPPSPGEPMSKADVDGALTEAKNRFSQLAVPLFTDTPLPIQLPSRPSSTLPAAPAGPSPLTAPEYPEVPVTGDPDLPEIRPVSLPTLDPPDLAAVEALIASLRASTPIAPVMASPEDFNSLALAYYALTNQQLTAFVGNCSALASLCPRLSELLSGTSTGLPPAVAQALRDRAFAAEDQQAFQAEQVAITDWLSRGFTLPGGALEAKLAQVRQLNRDKKAQLNRDLWVEEAKLEIENLRFAIQQGMSYEGMLRDSWAKLYGIVQSLAQTDIEVDLKILQAAIDLYKAKVSAWQVEFETIKDQLQAELAKLEIFKSELEGQKLIGQLNQQGIEIYKAQWEAIGIRVSIYKSQVEAADSLLKAEIAKLEWSAKMVAIYTAQVGAYESEWRAYGIAADAEKSKVELFDAQAKAFSSRVAGYASQVDAAKVMADLDITGVKLSLEAWQSQLEQYKAELQTEIARVESLVKQQSLGADIYKTKAFVESAYTDFGMKKLDYFLSVNKLEADITLKEADLEQTKELELSKVALSALDGIARTGSQLAGSAMSAMNVGASLSSGSTTSDQFSEYHYYEEKRV